MKIGIVSPFNDTEANSGYSLALEKEFICQGHSVKRYELPLSLISDTSSSTVMYVDSMIKSYADDLSSCDFISIQYDAGLYGTSIPDIYRRILSLADACKNGAFSITFHSLGLNAPSVFLPTPAVKNKKKRHFWKKEKIENRTVIPALSPVSFDDISRALIKKIIEKNGLAIVHTKRDEQKIKGEFPQIDIVSHPLNYYRADEIDKMRSSFSKKDFKSEFGIKEDDTICAIGILGTFHPHKDYETVINALNLLDEKYHLYIFGGVHKLSYKAFPNGLDRIKEMQKLIKEMNLTDRVHFKGVLLNNADMIRAFFFCDYVIMPYFEVGQMASASMGMAMDLSKYVFSTWNCSFNELRKFTGNSFYSFDIGNYMELADKIKNLPQKDEILENRKEYLKKYNISNTVKLYLKNMKG